MEQIARQMPILEVQNLTKQFHMHLIDGRIIEPLHALSFRVQAGHAFVISGRSGAGKTSILKCIYRTYLTTDGTIWYDSQRFGRIDLATADEDVIVALREQEVGFCSQFLKALPRIPAIAIVAEPLMKRGMARTAALEQATAWLKRLGIDESRWQASPLTFSGGEQQRINLARAFIAAPRLLLLDEPTASLDAASKSIVLTMMAEARKAGTTMLIVSHDMTALETLADEIYWLPHE